MTTPAAPYRNGGLSRAEIDVLAAAWSDPAAVIEVPDAVSVTAAKGLHALKRGGATSSTLRDAGEKRP